MATTRMLEITLISAKDLQDVNLISKMEVYTVVSVDGDRRTCQRTTADRDGGRNPTWNATLRLPLPADDPSRHVLHVLLRSERALGDRDVGEVHIPLKELVSGPGNAKGPQFVSYQVRKPSSGKAKGVLNLSYKISDSAAAHTAPAAAAPPMAYPPPAGKVGDQPAGHPAYPPPATTAYPAYPPPSTASKPTAEPVPAYPPAAANPSSSKPSKSDEPVSAYPTGPSAYPYPPQGYSAYPPPPPAEYGYPPPPPAGYVYGAPPPAGYAYGAVPPQKPQRNKFGAGLGAGLLGGAVGGLLIGDMISDGSSYDAGYDAGFDDGFGDSGGFDF